MKVSFPPFPSKRCSPVKAMSGFTARGRIFINTGTRRRHKKHKASPCASCGNPLLTGNGPISVKTSRGSVRREVDFHIDELSGAYGHRSSSGALRRCSERTTKSRVRHTAGGSPVESRRTCLNCKQCVGGG